MTTPIERFGLIAKSGSVRKIDIFRPRFRALTPSRSLLESAQLELFRFFSGSYFNLNQTAFWTFLFGLLFISVSLFIRRQLRLGKIVQVQKILLCGIIASIFIRVVYVLAVGRNGLVFFDGYYDRALSLYQGKGFADLGGSPTALFMPGYSLLLLAGFFFTGGPSYLGLLLVQVSLGFLTMLAVYLVASRMLDRTAGLIAAAVMGFFPGQILLETFIQSDLAFEAALWMGLVAFIYAVTPRQKTAPVMDSRFRGNDRGGGNDRRGYEMISKMVVLFSAAFLLAFASLTRPYGLILMFAYFAWCLYIIFKKEKTRFFQVLRSVTFILAVVLVLHGGWIWRNYRISHAFVPFTTCGGVNLWISNQPGVSGKFEGLPEAYYRTRGIQDEIAVDRRLKKEAIQYILNEPLVFIAKIPGKLFFFFGTETTLLGQLLSQLKLNNEWLKNLLAGIVNGYYLAFFVLGFWYCFVHFRSLLGSFAGSFGIMLFVVLTAMFSAFHVETRYHIPLVAGISIYAAGYIRNGFGKTGAQGGFPVTYST